MSNEGTGMGVTNSRLDVVIELPEERAFRYRGGAEVIARHFRWQMFDGNLFGRPCDPEGVVLKCYPFHFCESWKEGVEGIYPMSLDEAKNYGYGSTEEEA